MKRVIGVAWVIFLVLLMTPSAWAQGGGKKKKNRTSAHGSYEWKLNYGGGVEFGYYFANLDRWNQNVLQSSAGGVVEQGPAIDATGLGGFEAAFEISPYEDLRVTAFVSYANSFTSPSRLEAVFGGIEPMLAVRRGIFELGFGLGIGYGAQFLSTSDNRDAKLEALLIRLAIEPRFYVSELIGVYGRFSFNFYRGTSYDSDTLLLTSPGAGMGPDNPENDGDLLSDGWFYVGVGVRFGHYPEPVKVVPDTDGDGLRDDVDDCIDQAETEPGDEADGCP